MANVLGMKGEALQKGTNCFLPGKGGYDGIIQEKEGRKLKEMQKTTKCARVKRDGRCHS